MLLLLQGYGTFAPTVGQGETYLAAFAAHRLRAAHDVIRLAALHRDSRQSAEPSAHRQRANHAIIRLQSAHGVVRARAIRQARRMRALYRKSRKET